MDKIDKLERDIRDLIAQGYYNPNELFAIVYPSYPGHYHTVRRMIHDIKTDFTKKMELNNE